MQIYKLVNTNKYINYMYILNSTKLDNPDNQDYPRALNIYKCL